VAKSRSDKKAGQPNAIVRYFRETRGEVRKVTWPTRRESWRLTGIVLGVTVVTAAFLWLFDFIFSSGIQFLIERMIGL
jgi:preprotein translocase subunit SecE